MRENNRCSECGAILTEDTICYFNGRRFCEDCFNALTTTCDHCGERIWRDCAEGDAHYTLCGPCYDDHFTNCEDCGRLIPQDDANYLDDSDYPYCYDCYEKLTNNAIKCYNHKPAPVFHGSGNLFYGIELEIDKGGECGENAQKLLDLANAKEERIYCKHDGSINNGFEIVSHPMTYEYHTKEMNWADILKKAVEMDYRSHNTSTCGLHIHCSRSAFGENYESQEQTIARVVFFVEKHWNELVTFSRRTIDNLNHWAAKYATISETASETYKKAKNKCAGRYVAVNLENYSTIEFRLFRGTLRYKTFIATLQLVDEICRCAINISDWDMQNMSWLDFVQRIPADKPELIEYLKEKRLYVNEPSEEGVEE